MASVESVEWNERYQYAYELLRCSGEFDKLFYQQMFKSALVSDISSTLFSRSLSIALSLSLVYLDEQKSTLTWSNNQLLLSSIMERLVKTAILQYLMFDMSTLSSCAHTLLMAFLSQAQNNVERNDTLQSFHFISVSGPPTGFLLFQNQLVMDIPIPALLRKSFLSTNHRVALYNCSLEYPTQSQANVEVQLQGLSHSINGTESQYLDQFAAYLVANGVTLVICQKRVHPYLMRLLHKHHILCLPRVSIRFMQSLLRISGGRQLGGMPSFGTMEPEKLDASCLGQVRSCRCEYLFGKPYVVVTGHGLDSRSAYSTLLVISPTIEVTTALQEAAKDALHLLSSLLLDPFVLPGRGQWRLGLSQYLIKYCTQQREFFNIEGAISRNSMKEQILKGIEKFALCLVDCHPNTGTPLLGSVESYQECVTGLKTVVHTLTIMLNIDEEVFVESNSSV